MAVQVRATYKLTGWNSTQLKLRIPAILTAYDKVIYPQFKQEMKTVRYDWEPTWPAGHPKAGKPRITHRRNGEKVTTPRNIVDLGKLMNSQERIRSSATQLVYRWNAPYSALVLTGYTTNRGSVVRPRNWIQPALEAVPLDQFFAREWRRLASNRL
ncbi:MAG: hypothetical protein EBV32_00380 [Proteobacteria bacterium]|uniref:Uncharacterized protein n=1 Tax=Candidatus Fonsibacter lacus TaxID=2576439 RepID=A0A964XRM0_9PROT|nr:hypothetical protein [Candidatus Fonsibacter lacus]